MAPPSAISGDVSSSAAVDNTESKKIYTTSDIPLLMQQLHEIQQSGVMDSEKLKNIAQGFRKIMSVENNPPVHEVLNSGALPFLIHMLSMVDDEKVQFEAAWECTLAEMDEVGNRPGEKTLFVDYLNRIGVFLC